VILRDRNFGLCKKPGLKEISFVREENHTKKKIVATAEDSSPAPEE
jgi:hypothetical protein